LKVCLESFFLFTDMAVTMSQEAVEEVEALAVDIEGKLATKDIVA
jgi:hypothetical protein